MNKKGYKFGYILGTAVVTTAVLCGMAILVGITVKIVTWLV